MNDAATAYRTCPLCEATCGLELTIEGGRVTRIRGDAEDVFSHGFVCPKGAALKPLHEDPDRVRTPLVRTASGFEEVSWDEALRRDRATADADPRAPRPRRGGRLPGQPERPQPGCAALRPRAAEGARHAQHLLRHHRGPDAQARLRRPHVRRSAQHPDPGRRPHRPPADAGRQSAGVERQPADRARHARAACARSASAAAGSSWSTRGAAARPRRPTSTTSSGPGTDAHLLFGIAHVLFEEELADPGAMAEHCAGPGRGTRPGGRLRTGGGRRGVRDRARRDPAHGARARGAPRAPPSTGASAPAPRSSARSRAGSWTC